LRGDVALERARQQRELAVVPVPLRRVGGRMALRAVLRRVDVDAAREDHAVEHVERLVDRLRARRHDQRTAAGALDGLDVVERHQRRRQVPRAPARRLRIRGDADQRASAHRASVIECP
jgi:hypothetical protein